MHRDREAHRKAVHANNRRYNERNRQYVLEYLKEHPCIDCAETDPIVLEFDHVDGGTKDATISYLIGRACSIQRLRSEMDKCVVRCANCHRRKTSTERGWFRSYLQAA